MHTGWERGQCVARRGVQLLPTWSLAGTLVPDQEAGKTAKCQVKPRQERVRKDFWNILSVFFKRGLLPPQHNFSCSSSEPRTWPERSNSKPVKLKSLFEDDCFFFTVSVQLKLSKDVKQMKVYANLASFSFPSSRVLKICSLCSSQQSPRQRHEATKSTANQRLFYPVQLNSFKADEQVQRTRRESAPRGSQSP